MFLIVQNDPHCPAGSCLTLLQGGRHLFQVIAGYDPDPFPDPATLSGVIVLGGEMGVHQTERFPHLGRVRSLMAATVAHRVPLLGICLGGQLLAQLLGGRVSSPSLHGERGIHQVQLTALGEADPLFQGVAPRFTTFQLHNDSFTPPSGSHLLAYSPACPAQAFRYEDRAYAVQFHPEVDRSIVHRWSEFPPGEPELLQQFEASQASFEQASHRILLNFLSLAASPFCLEIQG